MKSLILISATIMFLSESCKEKSSTTESPQTATVAKTTVSPTADNSSNALDWEGTYKGVLPCADCEGIETAVTITNDLNYTITTSYLGKKDPATSTKKGSFTWNTEGNTITLAGIENAPSKYIIGENKLIQLDMNGNRITGDNADKYHLIKAAVIPAAGTVPADTDAPLTETYWRLTELMGNTIQTEEGKVKEMHIIFKTAANKAQGNGGCNSFGGTYTLKEGNRISFSQMISTMMACANLEKEKQFLDILQKVDNYSIKGNSLSLNRAKMAPLARFEAVNIK